MCRVMLADCEDLEIEALKVIIDRNVKLAKVIGKAQNGEEAIKMNDELDPDVIFLGLAMPGINGLEVANIIKKKDKNKKIILMSAYDDFKFVQKALRIKVDDYLLKPIRPQKIVSILNEFIKDTTRKIQEENTENCTEEFKEVIEYIDNNFKNDITLKDVANCVNFSSSYLSKLFKKEMGINFNRYITKIRINKAKELLINSTISVNEIAFSVGYNEPNYFCKVFKKIVKMTPSEYRTKAKFYHKNILI
ncbi:transcriptional regulator [Clostridium novyi A str. 4552]|uniref:Stage 0 sporulation protein A homolog n=1 Tax=Clostridium novyi A str. 4552 TaxID=1444289 RepID=A0A0A0I318_CLONO|nr:MULTISPECIES: response regulator transcription factor [Clostridium]EDS78019.1 transcriptional regulatory protein [Clostridium botulinum C str. Eklund]KEH97544.1 transcriptional regulator [Clostridium botulinum C/D str. BKT12695]KGM95774.1 transcriptional regulator [Clostridium novyi A str. 4552]NEZ48997.1 AraC family transcriptional regulator [Clostridium botulinum]